MVTEEYEIVHGGSSCGGRMVDSGGSGFHGVNYGYSG